MSVRDRRIHRVREVHEEGLIRLGEDVADDLDVDYLRSLPGQERQRSVARPVVDVRDRRPVGGCEIDGDRLVARGRKADGKRHVRVAGVAFELRGVADRQLDHTFGEGRPALDWGDDRARSRAGEREGEGHAQDKTGKKTVHATPGSIRNNRRNAPLAASIVKPLTTSTSACFSRTRPAADHFAARAGAAPKPASRSTAASATIASNTIVPTLDCGSEKPTGATVPLPTARLSLFRRSRAAASRSPRRVPRVDSSFGRSAGRAARLGAGTGAGTTAGGGGASSGAGGCAGGGWGETRAGGGSSGRGCGGTGFGSGRSPAVADVPPIRHETTARTIRSRGRRPRGGRS